MNSAQQVVNEVESHISKCGGRYQDWYAGVATDAKNRLFNDHNVSQDNDAWIYRQCVSDDAARQVEQLFLRKGCKGGPGGGGQTTRYFYAYKVKSHTRQ